MDFLTNPFTTALLILYRILGQNIVLTIVVFTVLVRLLTYPLTYQQVKSTRKMQELQPKLKKLQEKYKGNREALSQEQMKMYQENGVNPLAGCLPLLIQFPILIGLYAAISRALSSTPLQLLDLQHRILIPGLSNLVPLQHTFLWLNLAIPDPLYILPVLVVASTWLQQKLMTPPPATDNPNDPSVAMSRNMQIMMPLMIGMFSLQFASGLSIYWVVGNIIGIIQYATLGKVNLRNLFGKPAGQAVVTAIEEPKGKKKKAAFAAIEAGDTDAVTSTSTSAALDDGDDVPAGPSKKKVAATHRTVPRKKARAKQN